MSLITKIPNVRIAFPVLFDPQQFKGEGKPRYSCRLLLPKGSKQAALVQDAIDKAALEAWPKNAKNMLAGLVGNSNKYCLIDGDHGTVDGFADHMVLSANKSASDGRLVVVDSRGNPCVESDGIIYSGCYVNAIVEIWIQQKDYPGVRCKLAGIQFCRDGEPFSGGPRVTPDDFDFEVPEEANDLL